MSALELSELLEGELAPGFTLLGLHLGELLSLKATLLTLAVLFELLLPISSLWNLSLLVPIFKALARKVNTAHHSLAQRYFAGIMLPLLISAVSFGLLGIVQLISGSDRIIAFVLLIFLLRLNSCQVLCYRLKQALESNELIRAKRILAPLVLRETSNLSAMGLAKAGCESTVLRLFASWFAVMVWFLILGEFGALLMALSCVFCEAFNMKEEEYSSFGLFTSRLEQALLIVPAIALTLLTLLSRHPLAAIKVGLKASDEYPVKISGYVLGLIGAVTQVRLGGPRYYEGNLVRYPKVGGSDNPDAGSLLKVLRRVRFYGVLLLGISILLNLFIVEELPAVESLETPTVDEEAAPGNDLDKNGILI